MVFNRAERDRKNTGKETGESQSRRNKRFYTENKRKFMSSDREYTPELIRHLKDDVNLQVVLEELKKSIE